MKFKTNTSTTKRINQYFDAAVFSAAFTGIVSGNGFGVCHAPDHQTLTRHASALAQVILSARMTGGEIDWNESQIAKPESFTINA